MDSLDENLNSGVETRQLKKLQMYQKLILYTLLKFKISIMVIFLVTIGVGMIFRYIQFKRHHRQFEGSVTLFYTPRASEEVKILSINQVLGIFSRQQVFGSLIEELHLTELQREFLKQNIEVKLLKDQNDMFVITGYGDSDEYVKLMVNTFVAIGIRSYVEYRTAELRNYLEAREQRLRELQAYQKTQIENLHALHRRYGVIHPKEEMATVKKIQNEQAAALAELNVKLADARHRFAVAERNYKTIPENVIKHRVVLHEMVQALRRVTLEYDRAKLIFGERNPRYVEAQSAYEAVYNRFETFKRDNNITEFNETMLTGIDDIVSRYQEAEIILHELEVSFASLQAEKALINEKERVLQQMIPEHERIELLVGSGNKNISLLVEELTRVRGNIAHVPGDIMVNEHVVNPKALPMFPVKALMLIFIAGIFVSGIYAAVMVAYDIIYGKFGGIEEAGFNKGFFETVGIIPHEKADFTHEQRDIINNQLFYSFILRLKDTRTLFSCSLNGSFLSSVLFDEQFTKAKRNTILVRLISYKDEAEICGKMQKIGDFYYSDNGNSGVDYREKSTKKDIEYLQGFSSGDGFGYGYGYGFAFVPVRNLSVLEPDEVSKLCNIVEELKQHYQLVRIAREKPFDASCLMVRQLHDICDGTLLYIGKNKTPRRVLRRVLNLHDDKHKTYAIITDITDIEKVIAGDYIQ